jgi:hypothetical protein
VADYHTLAFPAPTASGRYIVIVTAVYDNPPEHGYSTQGFQIAVQAP